MMKVYNVLARKKPLTDEAPSKLAKVLGTLDLTALGVGSTLGVGVYVLAGEVSKTTAGPAVIFSFMIAAITSVFAGLCYAEFGARVPKAGSAYVYSYVTVGEFIAFLIGWNLILEYCIGSASVVKGLSTYLDSLLNDTMKNFFIEHMPMNSDGLGEYPDFFALGVTLLFAAAIAFGARESSMINNIFTVLNLSVVLYVIITGSFKADPINWAIPEEEVPEGYGTGGFAPYGLGGVIKGAAICFYGFVGFDCIATCGEEAKNPKKSIPIAVITSLAIIFVAYFAVSTVLTMMVPYYAQDANAPLPHVFRMYGWTVAEYIVSIGAMFGLCASLMGAMFPLPRIIYAMASDGLMFSFMGKIHPKYQTPLYGTLLAGLLTGCIAAMFNLSQLVNMMSIGTLMAYSIVAACVLLLRYEVDELTTKEAIQFRFKETIKQFVNARKFNEPNTFTSAFVTWGVALYCVWCVFFGSVMTFLWDDVAAAEGWAIFLVIFSGLLLIGTLLAINQQPTSGKELSFTVPLVPWIPALSILLNIYLMLQLDYMTWIRFLVWIIIGLAIYFTYGLRNSKEGKKMAIKAAD